jgi:hypothetical protein
VFLASDDDDAAAAEIGALAEILGFAPIKLGGLSECVLASNPLWAGTSSVWLGTMGNTLFFIAQPASSMPPGSVALFKSDGTTAGTTQVNGHEL